MAFAKTCPKLKFFAVPYFFSFLVKIAVLFLRSPCILELGIFCLRKVTEGESCQALQDVAGLWGIL